MQRVDQCERIAVDKAIAVRAAANPSAQLACADELEQAQVEQAKATKRLEMVGEQSNSVFRQLGERVWDWTSRDDIQRETFKEFVMVELARRRFHTERKLLAVPLDDKRAP